MNTRRFDKEDLRVSEIALGCWELGGDCWGDVGDEQALQALRTASECGIDFFDTADVYGGGRSEQLIGRFLAEGDRRPFVATKLGRGPDPGGEANCTLDAMRRHTEASIRRLGVDALDLTQLHCVSADQLRRGEVFDHLRALRDEGLIRRFGASVESMDEALICLDYEGLSSLQIIFNVFRQKPAEVLLDRAADAGVAIIVRLPLASGLLAGTMTRATTFPPNDHRNFNRDGQAFNVGETFAGIEFQKGIELTGRLASLVPAGMTMAQMAQRWILDHPAVTTVITGSNKPGHVRENAGVSELPALDADLHAKLRGFYEGEVAEHIRGPY